MKIGHYKTNNFKVKTKEGGAIITTNYILMNRLGRDGGTVGGRKAHGTQILVDQLNLYPPWGDRLCPLILAPPYFQTIPVKKQVKVKSRCIPNL